MKRGFRVAARLYPRAWRERYGAEFDALLEDAGRGWRDLPDVLRGALEMHMQSWNFRKLVAACTLAGAMIAAAAALRMPDRYISTSVIRIQQAGGARVPDDDLLGFVQQALSVQALEKLIRNEDLYPAARRRRSREEVIAQMRHDVRLSVLDRSDGRPTAFSLQYSYSDPVQAQRTTSALTAQLLEANLAAGMERQSPGQTLQVLDPPDLPRRTASPNRLLIIVAGTGGGFLMAALATLAMRPFRRAASGS
jgi:uncharacterized protein involved in exopolysaccharide biosynthesis